MIYMNTIILESRQKNNEEESSDNEEIDIQITIEENATNENNKNVIEIYQLFMYIFIWKSTWFEKKQNVFSLTFQN